MNLSRNFGHMGLPDIEHFAFCFFLEGAGVLTFAVLP
jgi:hypothetical protein